MIDKLVKTPEGRVLIHILVVLDNINHFRNPHMGVLFSGIYRYVKGIG